MHAVVFLITTRCQGGRKIASNTYILFLLYPNPLFPLLSTHTTQFRAAPPARAAVVVVDGVAAGTGAGAGLSPHPLFSSESLIASSLLGDIIWTRHASEEARTRKAETKGGKRKRKAKKRKERWSGGREGMVPPCEGVFHRRVVCTPTPTPVKVRVWEGRRAGGREGEREGATKGRERGKQNRDPARL